MSTPQMPVPLIRSAHPPMAALAWGATLLLLLVLLAGCGNDRTPTPLPTLQPTPEAGITPQTEATVVITGNNQLVVWLPAFTGFATEGSAGTLLTNAFHQFEQRNPAISLDIEVKADSGSASLFNFLRSSQEVAPSILPDLVLINTQQLWQIVDLGMVVPLSETEISGDDDFFRVARDAVRYRMQAVGIPYVVDVTHLIYNPQNVETPPTTWAELLADGHSLAFPAAEIGTANATLIHYIGAGGVLLEDGTVADGEALAAFFAFVADARRQDIIPTATLDMAGFNAVGRAFFEARTDLAAVQVAQYYPNAAGTNAPGYALMPTRNGTNTTVSETWAFAILTEDAQRRELARALITDLLAPEVQGPWSQGVARLPSRQASFAMWSQPDDYRDFVQLLLDNAVAPPNGPAFADFARRLHTAQAGLIRGDLTVDAAIASMGSVE